MAIEWVQELSKFDDLGNVVAVVQRTYIDVNEKERTAIYDGHDSYGPRWQINETEIVHIDYFYLNHSLTPINPWNLVDLIKQEWVEV